MALDEKELRDGTRFIVGKWQAEFVVNAFSNDLARIPAKEFKSDDGNDLSAITYEFFEDGTVVLKNSENGRTERGAWEQTDRYEYHYTLGAFLELPQGDFRTKAETLTVVDGYLTFDIGFLALGLKKTEQGAFTEPPDIGDLPDSGENAIVGRYAVFKMPGAAGESVGMLTREEALASLEASGMDEETKAEAISQYDTVVEFTPDRRVISWAKLPPDVSEAEIKEALEAGEIKEVRDGYYCAGENEWKAVNGKYYYDTGMERELFDEKVSSWDELKENEEGLIPFASGFMLLKRI